MEQYYEQFKGCIQREVPFCQAACPLHIDMADFMEKVERGVFDAAYKTYRNAVVFPAIVSALCKEPCKRDCPRADEAAGGGAIEIRALERTVVKHAVNREPQDYNVPVKKGRAAVIGAGISGLGCMLRLAARKYDVEIFEATDRIGGHLWELADGSASAGGLTPADFMDDIELQLKHEKYALHLNTRITKLETLVANSFDAIYIATGKGGDDFGLTRSAAGAVPDGEAYNAMEESGVSGANCCMIGDTACFAGGSILGKDTIEALADGLNIASAIETYFKTGNMAHPADQRKTKVRIDPSKLDHRAGRPAGADGGYAPEDASEEAGRCLRCQCDSCKIHCDLVAYAGKWPLRIKDEIQATLQPGSADLKPKPAKRRINTCTQCGVCLDACPAHIDMDHMFLEARSIMHKLERMPWAFHDFWLRDMEHANGEQSSIVRKPIGCDKPAYAFFPGCQLGASDPRHVLETYKWIIERQPDTAMLLQCCGIPVKWAGDKEAHLEAISKLRVNWDKLGKPILIAACPTCLKELSEFIPEIKTVSLYEFMLGKDDIQPAMQGGGRGWAIFDPCASKGKNGLRAAVRSIAGAAGVHLVPLSEQELNSACCSFGGHVETANADFAKFVIGRRINESAAPYITYCINCRDAFLRAGKETIHLLDVIFGGSVPDGVESGRGFGNGIESGGILPTATERRENRMKLKKQLLKEFWECDMDDKKPVYDKSICFGPDIKSKLNRERILEEDIINVVDFCEKTGRKIAVKEKGTFSGYRQVGRMTYWVEYRLADDGGIEVVNAYCHRMQIELEAVWNGRKTDIDL